jgi:hypothetical protein
VRRGVDSQPFSGITLPAAITSDSGAATAAMRTSRGA